MFDSRVLRKIFGSKWALEDWRRLHSEELNDLYAPNISRVIKSIRKRWAGHVARLGRGGEKT